jgi:hypothetical protein
MKNTTLSIGEAGTLQLQNPETMVAVTIEIHKLEEAVVGNTHMLPYLHSTVGADFIKTKHATLADILQALVDLVN